MSLMNYWSISSITLKEEAEALWLEVEIISKEKNTFYIRWNKKEILFKSTDFWWNSSLWTKIVNDKELSYKILEKNNLATAKTHYIKKENISEIDWIDFDFPLIIKPINESHWNWVKMNIQSKSELKKKLTKSFEKYNKMIIQKQINWDEFRILVLSGEVILWINRKNPYVVWNWVNNIQELIEIENKENKLRWEWYENPLSFIKIDEELIDYIKKQWLNLEYILEKWREIYVRWNSNIWSWWIAIDVTHKVSDDIKNICIKATKIFWLEICWVDIITSDISKPLSETGWIILELNATPWIGWHKELTSVNTGKVILEKLFF